MGNSSSVALTNCVHTYVKCIFAQRYLFTHYITMIYCAYKRKVLLLKISLRSLDSTSCWKKKINKACLWFCVEALKIARN